jgi:transcriptional regulator with GAF, ATPase, and Fis domain
VLLQGETGSGKEVVARAIHERSARRNQPLIFVNCGAIPSQLVESTLFGHEKGAFTGATSQSQGVFESAAGGTVLLDEIGELPAGAQAALLRVLETKRIVRVGSAREVAVDVRVVAATHRDLEAMCESGGFRLDLLYRLNAMTLVVPPLRARRQDVAALARRFLDHANEANGRTIRGFEPEVVELLEAYPWPGNVRELKNAIERAVVVARDATISISDLPDRIRGAVDGRSARPTTAIDSPARPEPAQTADAPFRDAVQRFETQLILDALKQTSGSQTAAARLLQMPLRTFIHKMNSYGIKKLGYGGG